MVMGEFRPAVGVQAVALSMSMQMVTSMIRPMQVSHMVISASTISSMQVLQMVASVSMTSPMQMVIYLSSTIPTIAISTSTAMPMQVSQMVVPSNNNLVPNKFHKVPSRYHKVPSRYHSSSLVPNRFHKVPNRSYKVPSRYYKVPSMVLRYHHSNAAIQMVHRCAGHTAVQAMVQDGTSTTMLGCSGFRLSTPRHFVLSNRPFILHSLLKQLICRQSTSGSNNFASRGILLSFQLMCSNFPLCSEPRKLPPGPG